MCAGSVSNHAYAQDRSVAEIAAGIGITTLIGIVFGVPQPDKDTDYVIGGLGIMDVIDDDGIETPEFRAEYRPGLTLYRFKPIVGGFVTGRGALSLYTGISHDLNVGKHLVFTATSGPALYIPNDGEDLGSNLVLHSSIEASYRFDNASRLSLTFHHMSHGEIFGPRNPGTEKLAITYAIPFGGPDNDKKSAVRP
ncbi:MAG: acyloxyacyl hydrolase [Alphaproteobacteria bacterium]